MHERLYRVTGTEHGGEEPAEMLDDELRQTYPFLVDIIDLEGFRRVVVEYGATRIAVADATEGTSQHDLP
jgi:hypothetical protein